MLNPSFRLGVLSSKRWVASGESRVGAASSPTRPRAATRSPLEALRERVPLACVLDREPPRHGDRRAFDAETAGVLRAFRVDAVLLLGYLYIITEPLLAAFPERILNIHDADLTLRNPDGGPRYPGLHSTRDAIVAGERETRSSVHLVTPQLDAGPVVALSEAFPVAPFVREAVLLGEHDIVRAYAYAQREWMMRSTWGTLAAEAVERLVMEAVA